MFTCDRAAQVSVPTPRLRAVPTPIGRAHPRPPPRVHATQAPAPAASAPTPADAGCGRLDAAAKPYVAPSTATGPGC